MAYIKEKTWSDYAGNVTDVTKASRAELEKIVRKASKTANQRMLRLERKGETKGAYRIAQQNLGANRRRFKENPTSLSMGALRKEFVMLRDFLSSKSSTLQGIASIRDNRYQSAVREGFKGSQEDWEWAVNKFFTENMERRLSSDAIRKAIVRQDTKALSEVQEIIEFDKEEKRSSGNLLGELMARSTHFEDLTFDDDLPF